MPLEQFLDLTPREFFDALRERETYESNMAFDQVRTICQTIRYHALVSVNTQRKRPIMNPKKLWVFSWEKEDVAPAQTKEEMVAMMKAIAKYYKSKKDKTKSNANKRRNSPRR